LLIETEIVDFR